MELSQERLRNERINLLVLYSLQFLRTSTISYIARTGDTQVLSLQHGKIAAVKIVFTTSSRQPVHIIYFRRTSRYFMAVAAKAAVRKRKCIPSLDWHLRCSEQARSHPTGHKTESRNATLGNRRTRNLIHETTNKTKGTSKPRKKERNPIVKILEKIKKPRE